MRGARQLLTVGAWGICAVVLLLALATARAVLDGERELRESDAAFDGNQLHAAIQHARRAASAYAPFAPHVERGYERLTAIARGAEASGDADLAALSWQAQRAACLESASLGQPFPERLDEANRNLARLAAVKGALGAEGDTARAARRLLDQARARSDGRGLWGALLALGLAVAAAGLALFASRAIDPSGRIDWLKGRLGLLLVASGAACWAVSAFRA